MSKHIETSCVQGGYSPKNGEPREVPIYQSTTFKYSSSEQMGKLFDLEAEGYFYTRLQNPTNDTVAAKICEMEGAQQLCLHLQARLQTSTLCSISANAADISLHQQISTAEPTTSSALL